MSALQSWPDWSYLAFKMQLTAGTKPLYSDFNKCHTFRATFFGTNIFPKGSNTTGMFGLLVKDGTESLAFANLQDMLQGAMTGCLADENVHETPPAEHFPKGRDRNVCLQSPPTTGRKPR